MQTQCSCQWSRRLTKKFGGTHFIRHQVCRCERDASAFCGMLNTENFAGHKLRLIG